MPYKRFYAGISGLEDFFRLIYRDYLDLDEKAKAFLFWDDNKTYKSVRNIEKLLHYAAYAEYFEANLHFHHADFTKNTLRRLCAIVIDFDLNPDPIRDRIMQPDEIADHIEKNTGITPNFVWHSGTYGNYQACFIIEPLTGHEKSVSLYEHLTKTIAFATGADIAAAKANQRFRIPKRGLFFYHDHVFSIDELKLVCERYAPQQQTKQEIATTGEVIDIREERLWRHPAVKALMNGKIIKGMRNHAAYTLALLFKDMGKSKEETTEWMRNNWLPLVKNQGDHDFTEKELIKCISSAYRGNKNASADWISQATGIEFPHKIKIAAQYKPKGVWYKTRNAIIDFLRQNNGKIEITIKELAKTLGIDYETVKKNINKLKKEKVLDVQTQRGRNGKTTIQLIKTPFDTVQDEDYVTIRDSAIS